VEIAFPAFVRLEERRVINNNILPVKKKTSYVEIVFKLLNFEEQPFLLFNYLIKQRQYKAIRIVHSCIKVY
jgi:hypothetical protein